MRVFIVRPFKVQQDIDFEAVEAELIRPALDRLKWKGGTTGEFVHAGDIKSDMMQELLLADVVVADISIHNPNVFYELGVRHALRDKATVLIRSAKDPVPFDIRGDRYVAYDKYALKDSIDALYAALKSTTERNSADSPVFRLLPRVKPHDIATLVTVPAELAEAIEIARQRRDVGQLALIASEVGEQPWSYTALLTIGLALFNFAAFKLAIRVYESVYRMRNDDAEANLRLSTLYHRVDDLARSNIAVERVKKLSDIKPKDACEALALQGRNHKTVWIQSWFNGATLVERQRMALASPLLEGAANAYHQGFLTNPLSYYAGFNALALFSLQEQLATAHPEVWSSAFSDDRKAEAALRELTDLCAQLHHCVAFACEAAKAFKDEEAWRVMTLADHAVLRREKSTRIENAYGRALAASRDFNAEAAARQLVLYRELGLYEEQVAAALRALKVSTNLPLIEPRKPKGMVIVATGHRVDAPNRETPRFPNTRVAAVREKMRAEIARAIDGVQGPKRGIAALASGTDIVFHEVCKELGVETDILLPIDVENFKKQSVADGGLDWVRRFDTLCDSSKPRILSDNATVPSWVTDRRSGIFQRGNIWLLETAAGIPNCNISLLAVWDEKPSGGEGGTADMVDFARQQGAQVQVIDPLS